jgi:RHH-type transcriptional regulator, proline utilization regulon repressor / proline dehydrogenase / delta 1-pyrroline-5-carboxylate dehydrogenase
VLGLMRAQNLDQAIDFANGTAFGLTGGIHTLDEREIEIYKERIQAGNLYINRHITGAIVQRQPFGGWKASNVGSTAKAGGPNYLLQMGLWRSTGLPALRAEATPTVADLLESCLQHLEKEEDYELLRVSAGSYAWAWQNYFSREHIPSQLLGEVNVLRYRPCRRVLLCVEDDTSQVAVAQVILAAATCAVPLAISVTARQRWAWLQALPLEVITEDETLRIERLAKGSQEFDRLRVLAPPSTPLRQAANNALLDVIDAPVLANGRLEVRHYLREQAISQTTHRYGNIMGSQLHQNNHQDGTAREVPISGSP